MCLILSTITIKGLLHKARINATSAVFCVRTAVTSHKLLFTQCVIATRYSILSESAGVEPQTAGDTSIH